MKLARQSTSELDRADRENAFSGKFDAKHLLRGNKHHFIIENATPAELKAIDGLLSETRFATCCDSRQDYDKGCSRGWWIAIEDVPAFKAEYKRLKGLVASRIEERKAEAVAQSLAAMTDEQVKIISRVACKVRMGLIQEECTVTSLRKPEYSNPAVNPFSSTRDALTPDLWALVAQCLIIGKNETCSSLLLLERSANEEIWRRQNASLDTVDIESAHAEALEMDVEYQAAIAIVAENLTLPVWDGCSETIKREVVKRHHDLALQEDDRWHWLEARHWVFWKDTIPAHRREELSKAHDEALAINYVLDAMPEGAGSLNGYVVQHAEGTFHNVSERNWTHNPLQASYFSPHDHQQGRMKQFCMNGEKIVRLGDACRSVAGQAKSPVHQPHKKE